MPADVPPLLRAPALLARRQKPIRTVQAGITWHDTAAGALADHGLSLSQGASDQSRPHWRLERLRPSGPLDWLPGHAAPLLAEGGSPDALGCVMPDGLTPVAAFNGRRRSMALRGDGAWLCVLEGTLRAGGRDRPACRLMLHGAADEVAALACELGKVARLAIPRAGLAAAALALVQECEPQPRRTGAPAIPPGLLVGEALGLTAAHLADVIVHWGALVPGAQSAEPVHQMRVAIRRLRSAFAVFRRVAQHNTGQGVWLDALDAALKALAAELGTARDWDVFLSGTGADVARVFGEDRRIVHLMEAARHRRAAAYASLEATLQGAAWASLQLTLGLLPTVQPWLADTVPEQAGLLAAPVEAFAAHALDRRLKHVVSPGKTVAHLPAVALHDIRKHAKRLRYATEFFGPLFPAKQVRRYLPRLERLQEALGTVNDAAVAAGLMAQLGGGADRAFATGVVLGFGAGRGARAARRVERAWSKFYRAAPFWD